MRKIDRKELFSTTPFDFIEEETSEDLDKDIIIEGRGFDDEEVEEGTDEDTAQDDIDDEGSNKTEEVEEEEELEIQANLTKIMAMRMKKEGQLPDDFEITEETTPDDVELAYRNFIEEKVRGEIETDVVSNIRDTYGDEEVLEIARRLKSGVTEDEIDTLQAYRILSGVDFDEDSDNYEKSVRYFFTQYYLDKNLPEDEAVDNAERDFENSDVESLIKKRKDYFNNKAISLDQDQRNAERDFRLSQENKRKEDILRINSLLDKAVIDNTQYSKQDMEAVRKALFDKTEIIEIDGKRHRVTPYYKKKYLRSQNQEQSLKDIIDFILGYDLKTVVKKASKISKSSLLDDLNEAVKVTVKRKIPQSQGGGIERRSLN